MKTFLVTVSALGLMTSVALAECAGHSNVTASADVDRSSSVSDEAKVAAAIQKKPVQQQEAATE